MFDIGDIVTYKRSDTRIYEIVTITLVGGQPLYKGCHYDTRVFTEFSPASEFTLVEQTTRPERGQCKVGDEVIVLRYKSSGGLGPVVECEEPTRGTIVSRYALVSGDYIHIVHIGDIIGLVHIEDMVDTTTYTLF